MKSILRTCVAGCASALILSVGLATDASAATLDFNTATYANSFDGFAATDTVDGVSFVIAPTARGVDGFRQDNRGGLKFGLPGNGMFTISITADQDLMYNSMYGIGHGFPGNAGQLPFDIDVGGIEASGNNMFVTAGHFATTYETVSFAGGPISVSAGESFFFHIDYDAFVGSTIYAAALVRSLDFSTVTGPSPIPLPAGLPLLIGGLVVLGALRRKKKPA